MKSQIIDQLLTTISGAFREPNDLIPILEQTDIEGKEFEEYFVEHEMYQILETTIMEKFFSRKWEGRLDISGSIFDYSTCLEIKLDPRGIFTRQRTSLWTYIAR